MEHTLQSPAVHAWIHRWGSPLNVHAAAPLQQNIGKLDAVAEQRSLNFRVFFARKANKCLTFVDAAKSVGAGIDTAGEIELQQTLDRGLDPSRIICTAAIKTAGLLTCCAKHGVTPAIDNDDEWTALEQIAAGLNRTVRIAVRVSGFRFKGTKLQSRFGIDIEEVLPLIDRHCRVPAAEGVRISGLHFHLDGYSAGHRIAAIEQLLPLIDTLRVRGHAIEFLDIGGGFPISYLESSQAWDHFWTEHELALLGRRSEVTYQNHGLGRVAIEGRVYGAPRVYPHYQQPVFAQWLTEILDAPAAGTTIADGIRRRKLRLQCEPGRSLLDGCGITVARVEFCKPHRDGYMLIGLAMNRTQCRTLDDDFLVDPILIPADHSDHRSDSEPMEGYLVGAYCTESELLSLRRFEFPGGIRRGDLIVFPNTAGYLMHFMESRSHQFPLAKNIFLDTAGSQGASLDDIDRCTQSSG